MRVDTLEDKKTKILTSTFAGVVDRVQDLGTWICYLASMTWNLIGYLASMTWTWIPTSLIGQTKGADLGDHAARSDCFVVQVPTVNSWIFP